MPQSAQQTAGLVKAREIYQAQTAHRSLSDPVRLAKAARIVRAALARQMIDVSELTPLPEPGAE